MLEQFAHVERSNHILWSLVILYINAESVQCLPSVVKYEELGNYPSLGKSQRNVSLSHIICTEHSNPELTIKTRSIHTIINDTNLLIYIYTYISIHFFFSWECGNIVHVNIWKILYNKVVCILPLKILK